jgi:hypothetical protein
MTVDAASAIRKKRLEAASLKQGAVSDMCADLLQLQQSPV